jgi:predicted Zn-dependent peptidase
MADNPAVTVLVMVETGSKYEKKEWNGLSHFLEHMVFKGTPKRPTAMDISKELESLGAHYNAFTSQEFTGYYAKVSKQHTDIALDVVSDIYLNPLLDGKEIEKEKGVIVEEIRMYKDMPHRHIHDLYMKLVYGDQPAGWKISGDEDNVKSFKREDFIKYRSEHYVAERTIVVVSGAISEKEILEKVEEAFSSIPQTKSLDKVRVNDEQSKPNLLLQYKETDQAHLILGVRTFDSKSKHSETLSVLSTLLGGGMSSRLFHKLRDEMGVGYYIHASNDTYTDHGLFNISAGVDTKRIEEVVGVLIAECKKIIDEDITEEELKKVKDCISGSFVLGLETSDSRAEYCASGLIMKGKIESPDEEIAKINKVTVSDIKELAKMIFVDEKLNLAIIGPYKDEDRAKFEKLLTFK